MKEIVTKSLKEILRVVLSACLAYLGLSSAGCVAVPNCGDNSSCNLIHL